MYKETLEIAKEHQKELDEKGIDVRITVYFDGDGYCKNCGMSLEEYPYMHFCSKVCYDEFFIDKRLQLEGTTL